MSSLVLGRFDLQEIRQVQRQAQSLEKFNASQVLPITEQIYPLAALIESHWSQLLPQDKSQLQEIAYAWVESAASHQALGQRLVASYYLLRLLWQGDLKAFRCLATAFDQLTDSILDALEREQDAYQLTLSVNLDALNGHPSEKAETVGSGEIRGWLASLSDS